MTRFFPAGYGFEFICFILESRWAIFVGCLMSAIICQWITSCGWLGFFLGGTIIPMLTILVATFLLYLGSHIGAGGPADWEDWIDVKDQSLKKKYHKKKIPMDQVYEAYISGNIDFKKDVYETMLHRNELFSFSFSFKLSVKWFFGTLLKQGVGHSPAMDKSEIKPVYDRGNDFYNWFLGETMVYTSGIFEDEDEKLTTAQIRKMETVCRFVHMKNGSEHLDIGCGWGTLLRHAAKVRNANSVGITLAKNQKEWHEKKCEEENVKNADSWVMDYRDLPTNKKYDCITCLEMAEHVGIRNFQAFLLQVKNLLKDDGLFYLQIAGLRRAWQYEDLVWGIFMGKYIFPAADASCPLGFVTSQLERAGFEVHRVENTGVHYSLTIKAWYKNWIKNKELIIKKYGTYWFRLWTMFLAWSTIIASQGSSTVFMITSNINHKNDLKSVYNGKTLKLFNRIGHWIGKDRIATQQ